MEGLDGQTSFSLIHLQLPAVQRYPFQTRRRAFPRLLNPTYHQHTHDFLPRFPAAAGDIMPRREKQTGRTFTGVPQYPTFMHLPPKPPFHYYLPLLSFPPFPRLHLAASPFPSPSLPFLPATIPCLHGAFCLICCVIGMDCGELGSGHFFYSNDRQTMPCNIWQWSVWDIVTLGLGMANTSLFVLPFLCWA